MEWTCRQKLEAADEGSGRAGAVGTGAGRTFSSPFSGFLASIFHLVFAEIDGQLSGVGPWVLQFAEPQPSRDSRVCVKCRRMDLGLSNRGQVAGPVAAPWPLIRRTRIASVSSPSFRGGADEILIQLLEIDCRHLRNVNSYSAHAPLAFCIICYLCLFSSGTWGSGSPGGYAAIWEVGCAKPPVGSGPQCSALAPVSQPGSPPPVDGSLAVRLVLLECPS